MGFAITCALAVLSAGCATTDMDECRKGDRRRCPGEASDFFRSRMAFAPSRVIAPAYVCRNDGYVQCDPQ